MQDLLLHSSIADPLIANLLSQVHVAVVALDSHQHVIYWNAAAERLYGWTAPEALGQSFPRLSQARWLEPDDGQRVSRALAETGEWFGESVHVTRAAVQRYVEASVTFCRDTDGAPIGTLWFIRDITERHQAQAARAELAAIVESSTDAIIGKTLGGIITSWNSGAEALYGYSAAEVVGKPIALLIPPDRPDELPAILERLQRGERVEPYETERITKDGRRLVVSLTVSPIKDTNSHVIGASAIARDMTARKETERALRVALSQLEAVLTSAADGILVQDPTGAILYANDAAARLCGFPSAASLRAVPIGEVLHNFELLDREGNPFPLADLPARRALRDGVAAEAVIGTRSPPGGDQRWSVSRARPVLDDRGRPAFAVSTFHDITALKLEEQRERFLGKASAVLAQSLDYDTTLARVAELAVPELADWATVDLVEPDGSIRRVALAHRDPAKVAWAHELERRYPTDPAATSGLPQVIRSGEPEFYPEIPRAVLEAAAVDDETRELLEELHLTSYLIVPLQARGSSLGAISFVYAESERHYTGADLALARDLATLAALAVDNARLYRDALTAVHVRDEFIASVSHDLRSPLTTIRGAVQLALRQLLRQPTEATPAHPVEALTSVEEAATRMDRMITSLLDLARLESGRPVALERQCVDFVALVRGLVSEHKQGAREHELVLEAAAPVLNGAWDPLRLERIVDNLLSNAIKYSPAGSIVRVTLASEFDADHGVTWARLDVEDEGIGIPAADLPRVFDRFHRGSTVGPTTPGIGIGLSSARRIAEQHGGTLAVTSQEGVGSRFTLRLPVTPDGPERH